MSKKYDVYGIGNALVDYELNVSDDFLSSNEVEKGMMTLVEQERQEQLLNAASEVHSESFPRACGGSAANTLIAVSQFGGKGFYSCKVAKDETGEFYLKDLASNGVDTFLTPQTAPEGVTGKCLVMVTPDAERTMNTFLGITATYSVDQLDKESLAQSKWLYIEGYLVASETGQHAALAAREHAKNNDVKIALTMSDPNMVKFFRTQMLDLVGDGVDLLFCNEAEAMEFAQTSDLSHAREELKKVAKQFVITLGKNGAILWDGNMFIDIEPHKVEAVDSNGAGDMYAGAFLYGVTHGHTPAGAATLASMASSSVVSQYGPRLKTAQAQEIRQQVFGE